MYKVTHNATNSHENTHFSKFCHFCNFRLIGMKPLRGTASNPAWCIYNINTTPAWFLYRKVACTKSCSMQQTVMKIHFFRKSIILAIFCRSTWNLYEAQLQTLVDAYIDQNHSRLISWLEIGVHKLMHNATNSHENAPFLKSLSFWQFLADRHETFTKHNFKPI